ncbi:hypothetical protein B0H13DRAFT_1909568 [Mycena leptocephala]|nr:hypothetical protein B0H13DRAFT_1909568 [Mycena leptocephala]
MSDQPPRTPFTPLYTPELSRDANGNLLYRDQDGRWLPYNGFLPVCSYSCSQNQQQAMPEQTPQPLGHVSSNDRSRGGPNSPIEHAFQPQHSPALYSHRPSPHAPARRCRSRPQGRSNNRERHWP